MPFSSVPSRSLVPARGLASPTALALSLALAGGAGVAAADWYVGAGGGVSRLTPDASGSGFTLEEEYSAAVGVFGGRNVGSRYAVELGAYRLGEAGLSASESIEYSVISGGALGYVFGDPARIRRGEAIGGYLKLGLGAIDNASDVPLEQEDELSVWAAAGLDVPIGRSWGLRAELASFDGDAQAALASIVWRPRGAASRPDQAGAPSRSAASEPAKVPAARPDVSDARAPASDPQPTAPREAARPTPPVAPRTDRTPAVEQPTVTLADASFDGVLDGVVFAPGTATLTSAAERELDGLAARLLANPGITIEIRAHALAGSDSAAAKALSRDRAVATARRLAGQGVPVARLRARAFGSEQPPTEPDVPDERIEIGVIVP